MLNEPNRNLEVDRLDSIRQEVDLSTDLKLADGRLSGCVDVWLDLSELTMEGICRSSKGFCLRPCIGMERNFLWIRCGPAWSLKQSLMLMMVEGLVGNR